ncbi:hypothetical protein DB41_HH00190 [Neochlamydia sp. TUME1]|nr:hypothetical protein DB41_HH00190 [Neochlamydia sp. TUME1]
MSSLSCKLIRHENHAFGQKANFARLNFLGSTDLASLKSMAYENKGLSLTFLFMVKAIRL